MSVSENARRKLMSLVAGVTLVLLFVLLVPRSTPVQLFRQLSPLLVSGGSVSQEHLLPLSHSEKLRQRIWVPQRGLARLTFFAVGDTLSSEPPHLRLREDDHGVAGRLLTEARASINPGARAHELVFSFVPLAVERQWVWAEIGSADLNGLRLAWEVNDHAYPGGHLVLVKETRERMLPGVLAFTSVVLEPRWPAASLVVLLGFILLAAWALLLPADGVDDGSFSA